MVDTCHYACIKLVKCITLRQANANYGCWVTMINTAAVHLEYVQHHVQCPYCRKSWKSIGTHILRNFYLKLKYL